ncbi:MAG: DUF2892 domain-containing protein [Dehalococcoidia bacterium]|nr:DUF2892 domain-containing protein [Dehalococcoidia bacterium]
MAQHSQSTVNPFVRFMASGAGRLLRIVIGVALILLGVFVLPAPWSWIVEAIGVIPIAAGIFDFCLLGPLFGVGFWGRDIRRRS